MEPPALTEADLIREYSSGRPQVRDASELATLVARGNKPVFLMDEHRIQGDDQFVFFSVVALVGQPALDALYALISAREQNPGVASRSALRIMRETAPWAVAFRAEIEAWLAKALILRVGIRTKSLGDWRRQAAEITTTPSNIRIKQGEHHLVRMAAREAALNLGLSGFQFVVVDRSMQNGMDPSQQGLTDRELGLIHQYDDRSRCHVAVLGSTPEDTMTGAWLHLPDYDAARATLEPAFPAFAEKVRAAESGQMMFWNVSFPGDRFGLSWPEKE